MATEMKRSAATIDRVEELLGDEARTLLDHTAHTIPKEQLHLPGPDFVDRVVAQSDRSPAVLRSLQSLIGNGRLAGTGYVSILPVDQGVEHSAGASFAPNPQYFDPENIVKLAIEGGCNGVASTFGVLGSIARKYAHKIPLIVKINHNEMLTLPNKFDQVLFGTVKEAKNLGAIAVGATETSEAFAQAHELGMACVLWCYLRNSKFKTPAGDMHAAADLTGQANHLGVTIQADIVKQKLPERNGGYPAVEKELGKSYGKTSKLVYEKLTTDNPIDLVRYQVANGYAVINKRGGGMGLISGRKAFQRPMNEGVELLNAIQDVYLAKEITVA